MKSKLFLFLGLCIIATVKSQNVGIGTSQPQEKLDIMGNLRAIIPNSVSPGDTFVLVVDNSGTFRKIPKSSLGYPTPQQSPTTSDYPTDLFSFHYNITGIGGQSAWGSSYMDSFYIAAYTNGGNPTPTIYSPLVGVQERVISTDWNSAESINSSVILKGYYYGCIFDYGSPNELRIYRYPVGQISSTPGTQMKFSGAVKPTPSANLEFAQMTSNGNYFYLNKNAGNNTNIYSLAKYRLSNDTLHYISTINLNAPTPYNSAIFMWGIIVDSSENFYTLIYPDQKVLKFHSSGAFVKSTDGKVHSNIRGLLNWNNKFYFANDYNASFQRFVFH